MYKFISGQRIRESCIQHADHTVFYYILWEKEKHDLMISNGLVYDWDMVRDMVRDTYSMRTYRVNG